MPVAVHRDLDRAVPKVGWIALGWAPWAISSEAQVCRRSWKADLRRQPGPREGRLEVAADRSCCGAVPTSGSEHERVTATRRAGQVGSQLVAEEPRQADGALA